MGDLKEYVELFKKLKGREVVVPQSREEAFRLAFLDAIIRTTKTVHHQRI